MTVHELIMYLIELENRGFYDSIVYIREDRFPLPRTEEIEKDNFNIGHNGSPRTTIVLQYNEDRQQ